MFTVKETMVALTREIKYHRKPDSSVYIYWTDEPTRPPKIVRISDRNTTDVINDVIARIDSELEPYYPNHKPIITKVKFRGKRGYSIWAGLISREIWRMINDEHQEITEPGSESPEV